MNILEIGCLPVLSAFLTAAMGTGYGIRPTVENPDASHVSKKLCEFRKHEEILHKAPQRSIDLGSLDAMQLFGMWLTLEYPMS